MDSNKPTESKREPHYINSSVVFVHQSTLIQDAVLDMISNGISSILVEDDKGHIVGIVTERDIVRKFTLLNVDDKLTRTIATIMTRPVEFVQLKSFHEQITKLHLERRIRHFPVLSGPEPIKANLVGIVSITDIARNYMLEELGRKKKTEVTAPTQKAVIGVIASNRGLVNNYIHIFNQFGFDAREVLDLNYFAKDRDVAHNTLVLDLDGYSDKAIHEMIPLAVKAKFYLVMTTSQPNLIPVFKKYINRERQEIAMKPIDISYLTWLIQTKWCVQADH
jgi:CBS domain-containing protein